MFALSGKKVSPGNNLGVLLEECATLTLGHASPHTELHAIVQGVGTAFRDHRAVPADHRGFALRGPSDEQLVRIGLATPSLRNPSNTGFCLFTLHNKLGRWIQGGVTSRGLDS